jgi:dipeptidyl aminopeptidase/acylaminoacyl peptidase
MFKRACIVLSLAAIILTCSCHRTERARRLPFEAFFQNPMKTSFLISPDGESISYLQNYNNRLNLFVRSLDGRQARRITSFNDGNVSSYFWAGNDELFFMKDPAPGDYGPSLFSVNRRGGGVKNLLPPGKFRIRLLNSNRIKNDELLLALNLRDSSLFDVYRLNVRSGQLSLAATNPGNITEWFADEDAHLRLAFSSDGVFETLLFRRNDSDRFSPVITNNFKTNIIPVGFCGQNPTCIYALSNQNRDKMALVEFDCLTGKEKKIIFAHPEVDVTDGGYSLSKRRPMYAAFETWKKQRHYLNDSVRAVYQKIESLLPNTEIRVASKDLSEKRLIIRTFKDKTPGAYYLYMINEQKLYKLSDINPSLPESELCEMRPVAFTSRDGMTINAYLTLPKGSDGKELPVIVITHPNPEARNSWGFNSEVQFLANRGYAVFQVNHRGSTGYGKTFWIAGFKQWGGKIQDDITDGVKWLIDKKVADPKRIAIYGASFGGYSALMAVSQHPELYRCGVSYSGLLNLFSHIRAVPPYYKPYLQMFYEKVGDPEADADYFREVSPIFHTEDFRLPMLIVQGAKDPRVNVNEANQFVQRLKKRNVPVQYLLKENEGHSFRNTENRQEFYRTLERFLADNLGKK